MHYSKCYATQNVAHFEIKMLHKCTIQNVTQFKMVTQLKMLQNSKCYAKMLHILISKCYRSAQFKMLRNSKCYATQNVAHFEIKMLHKCEIQNVT